MKAIRIFALIIAFISFTTVQAQINLGEKIKQKAKDRLEQKTDQGIDKGLDKTEEGATNAVKKGKKDKKDDSNSEATNDDKTDENAAKPEVKAEPKPQEEGLKSYTKYDFVPGDQILLFEDFSQDAVGDFPALWTTTGSGEIRTLNKYPGNWLYMSTKDKMYALMKNLNLPENFILEFDVIPHQENPEDGNYSFYLSMFKTQVEDYNDDGLLPGDVGFHISFSDANWGAQSYKEGNYIVDGSSDLSPLESEKVNHVIIWVQKQRLRIYHKGAKVMDLPTILVKEKYDRLRFSLWGQSALPFITNIRITTAAPDTRSKLLTEGKLISYGIYFDVNSDKVKPESNGALNDIAKVLKENPTVNIKIVGHTDSDGEDAKNLDLSKRRAASVKNSLEKEFGIEGARMQTDGKGESAPIAPNDKPENKSKNRRVEFIKL